MRKVFWICTIGLLFLFAAANCSVAEDWPTYRHNNSRTGATKEKLALPLQERWAYTSPAVPQLSWSGPDNRTIEGLKLRHRVNYDDALQVAIVGKKLYFGSSVDHQVRCIDLPTGEQHWTFFTGGPVRLAPTVWNGNVYFGSDDGFVYCLNADTGRVNWKIRGGPADEKFIGRSEMISRWPVRTGVAIHEGVAYFGAGLFPHEDIFLYAVDAKNGKLIWKRDNISEEDAGRNSISPQGYLLANERYLFTPSGRMLPACFDRLTGKLNYHRTASWRRDGVVGGTRALLADGQIYTGGPHQMLALDQKTGGVGFAYIEGKQMAVVGKDALTANGTAVSRLDRVTNANASSARQKLTNTLKNLLRRLRNPGKDAKKLKAEAAKLMKQISDVGNKGVAWFTPLKSMSSLIIADNLVFVGGENQVHALDFETGKIVWQAKADGNVRGLAAANGYLVASTTKGRIHVFADAAQPKQKVVPPARFVSNPYADDNSAKIYQTAAEEILKNANLKRGFCLVIGATKGQLAFELAKRSELRIFGVEPDAKKVAEARLRLSKAGLYGHRIVVHQADLNAIPYSNFFANLVVVGDASPGQKLPVDGKPFVRHVKPFGGILCLGHASAVKSAPGAAAKFKKWLDDATFATIGKVETRDSWAMFKRGKLRGAGNWTHQYGDPGNTATSDDQIVKGGLGVLWYGDPGPGKMVNRHEGAVGPLSLNGRLIVQGQFSVMAYDAYNGMFLWEYKNPKTFRTGVFQNYNSSNLLASDDSVFVMEGNKVVQLDIATGKLQAAHQLPADKRDSYQWNYVAHQNGILFGTATIRKELEAFLRRRGRKFEDMTDTVFAIDVKTGKYLWNYKGDNIAAPTIALGPDQIFFVDSTITHAQREAMLRKYNEWAKKQTGKAAKFAEARMKKLDLRTAVALDARSGKQLWSKPIDVTDCSEIGIGGGKLTLIYKDDVLLLCGANANGHYWRQFVAGEFERRRLLALAAKDGKVLWAKDANYRHRPIILGKKVIAEPWAFDLNTGKQIMRKHPLTGKEVPWSMYRPGHHCGMLTGCPNMLMFRSGYTGFYDLYSDGGTRHFAGHRLGCWINAIPANGLVTIPEASAGCVCQFSIASTITLEPRKARRPWTIYSTVGQSTPVEHMALNLGAPGDRKSGGTVWLGYPRPNPLRAAKLELRLNLKEQFVQKKGGFKSVSAQQTKVEADDAPPWVFTSWAQGLKTLTLPLRGAKDEPAKYTVRLYFADLGEKSATGKRVFDVKLNGKVVLEKFDIAAARKSNTGVVIREIPGVNVKSNLVVELVARTGQPNMRQLPVLNGIEVRKE